MWCHWGGRAGRSDLQGPTPRFLASHAHLRPPLRSTELHSKLLAARDVANCVLSKHLGFTGKHSTCGLTGLPWLNCCGGRPIPVTIAKHMLQVGATARVWVGPTHGRRCVACLAARFLKDASFTPPLPPSQGHSFEKARTLMEEAVETGGARKRTRQPINPHYPPWEGSPRLTEHLRYVRRAIRKACKPQFAKQKTV